MLAQIQAVPLAYSAHYKNISLSGHSSVVILHGLLGSKSNWNSLSKLINERTGLKVYALDHRNHGESPHTKEMNYDLLANDIELFLRNNNINKVKLVGHSLGGRAAIKYAFQFPEKVEDLVVVDVSHVKRRATLSEIPDILRALSELDLTRTKNLPEARSLADKALVPVCPRGVIECILWFNNWAIIFNIYFLLVGWFKYLLDYRTIFAWIHYVKILLMRAIVESTLLYACESWTVSKNMEQKLRAFEMKTYRRMLGISWKEKKTNEWVRNEVKRICGSELESVMDTMKRRKFKYFGHMVRGGGMARAILEGGVEGSRGRGRPMGNWLRNLKEWSGQAASVLIRRAEDRVLWRNSVRAWSKPVRQFLCTNLYKDSNNVIKWRFNLATLKETFPESLISYPQPVTEIFNGPTTFIAGENSDYILPEDHNKILKNFPKANIHYIPGAGHFVHSEKPFEFLDILIPAIQQE
ncbi:Protein ABHD11 [Nymphon striatum]|nr:Protein ABHD11 [Nymphon striatum]